jgi:short-subunit dehydrogenase
MNLANKIVWVTGASSGIGEAITYALAKEGCKLILSSRRVEELNRVRNNIKIADEDILILPLDLEQHQQANEWVKKVMDKFSRIDVLINNGGISQKSFALETQAIVERKIMDINYFGSVALSKAVATIMQQQKSGKIVAIASIIGRFGLPDLSTYSASKHAIYGFYDSFRLELRDDNIKILIVSPGFINTNVAINAIKGDGDLVKENSHAMEKGMKTDVFAKKFMRALKSNKNHKYIGKSEIYAVPFKLLFPNTFYNLMYKMSKKSK